MKRRWIALLAALCMLLAASAMAEEMVTADAPVAEIKSYGNVTVQLAGAEMAQAGFTLGDVVDVSFGSQTVTMPYGSNYTDVDSGCPVLVWRMTKDDHVLAMNSGDFASTYGLAEKTEDGWRSDEGDAVRVTITMNTPAGYYEQYTIRSMHYTDDRADYPALTDEAFANFREVKVTGMAAGRLYRGCSPINDEHHRAAYSAAAQKAVGANVVLNLVDTPETMPEMALYPDSWYATDCDVFCLGLGVDMTAPENMQALGEGLRFALAHEGPIFVHCKEGKDRAGYVCAVLELLVGAPMDEVLDDYMMSFANYYSLTPVDEAWQLTYANFERMLTGALGETPDAEDFLLRCGLTTEEIGALKARLAD